MIVDLESAPRHDHIAADVIVVGAGTIGLPIGVLIAERSKARVVCLESGGLHQDTEAHPLNEVIYRANHYSGATAGRYRCLGGTSTRWGGALIPFQHADFDHAQWPLSPEELDPYIPRVEALFGLEGGSYTDERFPFALGATHVNRLAKWPPFTNRNVASLFAPQIRSSKNLTLFVNATVTQIAVDSAGSRVEVIATAPARNTLRVSAPRLLIAAGAIETTRLALLIDRSHDRKVSTESPALGRYFSDHVGMAVADVQPLKRTALNKLVGWRFGSRGTMRNIRFELSPSTALRRELPPSFTYLSPTVGGDSGWAALRELYRYAQRRRFPTMTACAEVLRNALWIAKAAYWRFVNKRLLLPDNGPLKVCVVQEQLADPNNRITLSDERVDCFGIPMAEITWSPTAKDIEDVIRSASLFEEMWNATEFKTYGRLTPYPHEAIRRGTLESSGVYHATGSTRMGRDASRGVVDKDLRLFAFPCIQLISTSVLPTGGGANPTMMALMLGLRCVDQMLNRS